MFSRKKGVNVTLSDQFHNKKLSDIKLEENILIVIPDCLLCQ